MTIENVTPEVFGKLKVKLVITHEAEVIGGTIGTIIGHGVTANYSYDAASQILTVDVIHHPFYIPVSAIENQLREAVAAA